MVQHFSFRLKGLDPCMVRRNGRRLGDCGSERKKDVLQIFCFLLFFAISSPQPRLGCISFAPLSFQKELLSRVRVRFEVHGGFRIEARTSPVVKDSSCQILVFTFLLFGCFHHPPRSAE